MEEPQLNIYLLTLFVIPQLGWSCITAIIVGSDRNGEALSNIEIMFRMLSFVALLLCLSTACKKHTIDDLPTTQLHFGSGGGFAGAYTAYLLLENGQCFKKESLNGTYQAIGKAKKSAAKALFDQWESAKLGAMDFKHPGNLYYFVAMEVEGQTHRLSWGASGHPAVDQLKAFYQACNALIPQEKSTSN